jgi:hypothetical protein
LLPIVFEHEKDVPSECLLRGIERIIPLEKNRERLFSYFQLLIHAENPQAYPLLVNQKENGLINDKEFWDLLALKPAISLEFLRDSTIIDEADQWITSLEERFPAIAGLFLSGMTLQTPFGLATLTSMEDGQNNSLTRAHQSDENIILNVTAGEGKEKIQARLNFYDMTITFIGCTIAWGCGHCDFVHPDQETTNSHCRNTHRFERVSLRRITGKIYFSPSEIIPFSKSQEENRE